ncbi:uncharacterized protein LOC143240907 isoform X2 [Tachypleus tridentatus]|uniref:uncharacterized protein LOC143240907 isoform X2 n=1 Tax=Tachypleus tridentatus TaxID=6853 RepID=UPI003FD00317
MRDSTQIYWIHKMYGWVGTYRPPCRASGGLLCHLQKTIKHESSERQTCITNFNTSLVKDIDELKQEVKELKRDVEGSSYWPCRDWENRNNKRFSQIICSLVCCV